MWSTAVDLYCERADPSFWAEPLNAVTNAAFLIAAAAATVALVSRREPDLAVLALIVVAAMVGYRVVCLSHGRHPQRGRTWTSFRSRSSSTAICCWRCAACCGIGWTWHPRRPGVVRGRVTWACVRGAARIPQRLVCLSAGAHGPALGGLPREGRRTQRGTIFLAAGLFALSLSFRTIDLTICAVFPLGTHFIWHSLNAVVLYLLLRAAMKHGRRTAHMRPYSQAMPS